MKDRFAKRPSSVMNGRRKPGAPFWRSWNSAERTLAESFGMNDHFGSPKWFCCP